MFNIKYYDLFVQNFNKFQYIDLYESHKSNTFFIEYTIPFSYMRIEKKCIKSDTCFNATTISTYKSFNQRLRGSSIGNRTAEATLIRIAMLRIILFHYTI